MPLAKIHVLEGHYDHNRLAKVSDAIQAALMNTLHVPPEDFFQLIFELPKNHFLHTPAFIGMHYTDDLIVLDLTFIQGRPKETRLVRPRLDRDCTANSEIDGRPIWPRTSRLGLWLDFHWPSDRRR